jgi:radical SAM protein with 4Fe4S-binding SPASM domain
LERWYPNTEDNFKGIEMMELRILPDIFLSNFNLSKPYKLTFAVTYKCNYRCVHCNIWRKKPKNELTLDEISEFSKKYPYFKWFNLTGGEPFLRTDLVEIIETLKENSNDFLIFNMITNGFNPSYIYEKSKEIVKLKIPRTIIGVSLDGYKELHEKIRGIKGSFERAIETFLLLRNLSKESKNFRTYFGYTISSWNVGNFLKSYFEVKSVVKDLSLDDFHINSYHVSPHYYSNLKFFGSLEGIQKEVEHISKLKPYFKANLVNFLDNLFLRKLAEFLKTNRTPYPCKALTSSVFIDSFGNVYPCGIWNVRLGNLRENGYDLEKILKSKESRKLRVLIRKLKCPNCWTACEAYQTIIGNVFSMI